MSTESLLQELIDVNKKILKVGINNGYKLDEARTPGIISTIGRNVVSNFIWYVILGLIIVLLVVILWNSIKSFFSSFFTNIGKSILGL